MKTLFILLVTLTIGVVYSHSELNTGVKVIKTFGEASCQKLGQTEWNKLNQGDALVANDIARTGLNSYAELELSPENKVRLKEKSQILVKDLEKESQQADGSVIRLTDFSLIEGDLALQLDKLPKNTIIQVSSPTAVAGARGTSYVVKYDSNAKTTNVGVLNNKVSVQSVGEPTKIIDVPTFKKVTVTPWVMATPRVRGTGVLSEKILGRQFIQAAADPIMQVKGVGETEENAKDNAYYNLAKNILSISVAIDKRVEDLLAEDPSLCQSLYSYISKAEIISSKTGEVVVQLRLAGISEIIGKKLPPMPSVVKQITIEEYGDKFGPLARTTTQRAAQLDGYRKLAEIMFSTVISSQTILKDMAIKDDRITTTVEGVVKGAETLDTLYFSDGSITLVMAVRADLVRSEVAKITGDVFGVNYFTSPSVIDIDDFLKIDNLYAFN